MCTGFSSFEVSGTKRNTFPYIVAPYHVHQPCTEEWHHDMWWFNHHTMFDCTRLLTSLAFHKSNWHISGMARRRTLCWSQGLVHMKFNHCLIRLRWPEYSRSGSWLNWALFWLLCSHLCQWSLSEIRNDFTLPIIDTRSHRICATGIFLVNALGGKETKWPAGKINRHTNFNKLKHVNVSGTARYWSRHCRPSTKHHPKKWNIHTPQQFTCISQSGCNGLCKAIGKSHTLGGSLATLREGTVWYFGHDLLCVLMVQTCIPQLARRHCAANVIWSLKHRCGRKVAPWMYGSPITYPMMADPALLMLTRHTCLPSKLRFKFQPR